MRRPKTDQITHEQPLMCEWEEYCDWLEAQVEALRDNYAQAVMWLVKETGLDALAVRQHINNHEE